MANKKLDELAVATEALSTNLVHIKDVGDSNADEAITVGNLVQSLIGVPSTSTNITTDDKFLFKDITSGNSYAITLLSILQSRAFRNTNVLGGHRAGIEVSNNSGNPDEELDITAGTVASEDGTVYIDGGVATIDILATTGGGGHRPTTVSLSANKWYYVLICAESDGGNPVYRIDETRDATKALAELAGDYSKYRLLRTIRTDATSDIIPFHAYGNKVFWDSPVETENRKNVINDTRVLLSTLAPPNTIANFCASLHATAFVTNEYVIFTATDTPQIEPDGDNYHIQASYPVSGSYSEQTIYMEMRVDANSQFYMEGDDPDLEMDIISTGFVDTFM